MSDIRFDIEQRVNIDKLNILYSETWNSILSTLLIIAAFIFVISTQQEPARFLVWYGVLAVVLFGRAINYWKYSRAKLSFENTRSWCLRFRLGILATGLVMGSSSVLFFQQIPVAYQIFSIFVLAGISAGALTVLISDYIAFFLYINATLLPAAIISARYNDHLHIAISVMILLYIVLLMRSSRSLYRKVVASLVLGYENQVLAERLTQEKNRLDNRLGRILNDSSSEIYIYEVNTLQCLQVNQGALQHLGYNENEIEGRSILDILIDVDRDAFNELLEPMYDGTQESVFFHGWHRRKDGSSYPVEVRLQLSLVESPPVVVATALDITEREEAKSQLVHQANFDQLTDLANRFFILPHIKQAFSRTRSTRSKAALLFMDLDDFKQVNDTLGHNSGDALLKEAAGRIRSVLRESDIPARIGGDEFLVLLEGLTSVEQVERIAGRLVDVFKSPFSIGSNEVYTSTSIGISLFPDDGTSVDELMQYADTALYHAKQNGRSNYQFFSDEMRVAVEQQHEMEGQLRGALENDEMSLVYQPKVDAVSGRILGAEALLRWTSPALGSVSPDQFIPLAENLGLIGTIGNWVINEACREAVQWSAFSDSELHVAVNVSSHQFHGGRLFSDVDQALKASKFPADRLELEITESLLIQDSSELQDTLNKLRERGISLSLDDFGTGYSSLSYLKRFPLQVLKIDRSFVKDLTVDSHSEALVEAIIAMARSLDLDIVAEGVENQQQLEFLSKRGVSIIQGYYFSPPVTAAEFRSLLKQGAVYREDMPSQANG